MEPYVIQIAKGCHLEIDINLYLKKRHSYVSSGTRFSVKYCQHIRPIRSCTVAVARVTTIMGKGRSISDAIVRKISIFFVGAPPPD